MQHCVDKTQSPCFQYRDVDQLNEFLLANGGKPAHLLDDGTAIFASQFKVEERLVYVKPGAWVQVKGRGQFFTHSDERFHERFALVKETLAEEVTTLQTATSEVVEASLKRVNVPGWLSKIMARQVNRKGK